MRELVECSNVQITQNEFHEELESLYVAEITD